MGSEYATNNVAALYLGVICIYMYTCDDEMINFPAGCVVGGLFKHLVKLFTVLCQGTQRVKISYVFCFNFNEYVGI